MKETTGTQNKFIPLIFIDMYNKYSGGTAIYTTFYCTIHEYIHLFLLYNNRLDSSTPLTEKNILPISWVFANKAELRVPEESVNFVLSDFYLVQAIEVNEFLGTQGDGVRNNPFTTSFVLISTPYIAFGIQGGHFITFPFYFEKPRGSFIKFLHLQTAR